MSSMIAERRRQTNGQYNIEGAGTLILPFLKLDSSDVNEQRLLSESVLELTFIDNRTFIRDSLVNSFASVEPMLHLNCFSSLADWKSNQITHSGTLLVLSSWLKSQNEEIIPILTQIHARCPITYLVVLCDTDESYDYSEMVSHGVKGYVSYNTTIKIIAKVIELVSAGGVYISPELINPSDDTKINTITEHKFRGRNEIFTSREMAVVDAMRHGKSNKIIAHELNMSESTVKAHLHNVMRKINARNRTEVVFILNQFDRRETVEGQSSDSERASGL